MSLFKIVGIAEIHYELVLNVMMGKPEDYNAFGLFPTRQMAIDFYKSQLAEQSYEEEAFDAFIGKRRTFIKHFKKGSPFEWLNPLTPEQLNEKPCSLNFGIQEIVVNVKHVIEKEYLHD